MDKGPGSAEASAYQTARDFDQALAALDPDAASRCISDGSMSLLLRQDPRAAAGVLERAYILDDLARLVESSRKRALRGGLLDRFSGNAPLLRVGLKPTEDSLLGWTLRYRPRMAGRVGFAIKTWRRLTSEQRDWLSSHGHTESSWKDLPLDKRDLGPWARAAFGEWKALPVPRTLSGWKEYRTRARRIAEGLSPGEVSDLIDHRLAAQALLQARLALREALGREPGLSDVLEGLEERSSRPFKSQLDFLGGALRGRWASSLPEKVVRAIDSERSSRPEESIPPEVWPGLASRLTRAVLDELRGTREGGRVLRFLSRRDLATDMADLGGANAEFSSSKKRITFDSGSVEQWLRENRWTLADLLGGTDVMRRLARFFAPSFVHEATHYRQHALFEAEGVSDAYTQESEVEAFFSALLFVSEKEALEPGYLREVDGDKLRMAAEFLRSPGDLAGRVRQMYFKRKSLPLRQAEHLNLLRELLDERRRPAPPSRTLRGILEDSLDERGLPDFSDLRCDLEMLASESLRFWSAYLVHWREKTDSWAASSWARALRELGSREGWK
jgi:hypothetical protein